MIAHEKLNEIKSYLEGILKEKGRVGRDDILKKYKSNEFSEKTDPDSTDSSALAIFREMNLNNNYILVNITFVAKIHTSSLFFFCPNLKDEL